MQELQKERINAEDHVNELKAIAKHIKSQVSKTTLNFQTCSVCSFKAKFRETSLKNDPFIPFFLNGYLKLKKLQKSIWRSKYLKQKDHNK